MSVSLFSFLYGLWLRSKRVREHLKLTVKKKTLDQSLLAVLFSVHTNQKMSLVWSLLCDCALNHSTLPTTSESYRLKKEMAQIQCSRNWDWLFLGQAPKTQDPTLDLIWSQLKDTTYICYEILERKSKFRILFILAMREKNLIATSLTFTTPSSRSGARPWSGCYQHSIFNANNINEMRYKSWDYRFEDKTSCI